MNLFKSIAAAFIIALLLNACQGNNNDAVDVNTTQTNVVLPLPDANTTVQSVTVVLPTSSTILTTNSQVVNIDVRVFDSANNPYSDGTVKLINSADVLDGRDVGGFDKYSSTLVNGVATFVYTAPDQLDINTSNLSFGFYHDSNSSKIKTYTMSIVPETNQTVLTNYTLSASNATDVTMDLESSKTISYTVNDANSNPLSNASMVSMTVTSLNPSLLTLSDSFGNNNVTTLTLNSKNNMTINVNSNTISGLVPIKVVAKFNDANNVEQNITKVFDIVVLSGPPTAMSLSYASTSQNSTNAKFIENWVLTVTDKYNNLVNTAPAISMGLITGFATSSATTANPASYLYYDTNIGGTLSDVAFNDTFTSPSTPFSNVDLVNDTLVLFGTGYKFNAFGKWDIDNISSSSVLSLVDDFNGTDVSGLGYAVGHNFRNETCSGSSVVANVYPLDKNYILGNDGSMIIQVEYDYYLVGKSVMLWTNLIGNSNNSTIKIGQAKKITLRGQGLVGGSKNIAKGFTGIIRLNLSIANTIEFYKNANFGYDVEVSSSDTNWSIIGTSMDGGITSCINNGIAYVDVNISSPAGSAGTVKLTNVLPSNEF
jgi:hypothetical protein